MRVLEIIHALEMAHELYGDVVVDIVNHTENSIKQYWIESINMKKNKVSIIFQEKDRYKGEIKNES